MNPFLPDWTGIFVTTRAGAQIGDCIDAALELSRRLGLLVVFCHNGVVVEVRQDSSRSDLYESWERGMQA